LACSILSIEICHSSDAAGRDRLAVYFGGGVRHQFMDPRSDRFGFRGVGGVAYHLSNIPVDVFLEGGPILDVTPDTKLRFGIGIGIGSESCRNEGTRE
jgi:hypothetical protein